MAASDLAKLYKIHQHPADKHNKAFTTKISSGFLQN